MPEVSLLGLSTLCTQLETQWVGLECVGVGSNSLARPPNSPPVPFKVVSNLLWSTVRACCLPVHHTPSCDEGQRSTCRWSRCASMTAE
ncbi:hypothetical protein PF006_g31776, partial [Phytophthora fragariae]